MSVVASRNQQVIAASVILTCSCWIAFVSFYVDDPEPFLFPRLIAVAMLVLSALAFRRALAGGNITGSGFDKATLINIAPGVALAIIYIGFLAEWMGFYAASMLIFFLIYSIYDPAPHFDTKVLGKRILITTGFMAVMYLVFSLALKVQTPRGFFF